MPFDETPELILHHYDFSNFAEKIRLIFGHKKLSWASVITPMFLPKPILTTLTGGYRKVPVLQIGADIYCDTLCIALEVERRFPEHTLFPHHSTGLAMAVANWAERSLLWPTARFATGAVADQLPTQFHADRAAMWGVPLNIERYRAAAPRHRMQMIAQLGWIESMLERSSGKFLLGNALSLADLAVYHPLWLVGRCSANLTEAFAPFSKLRNWMELIEMTGHGVRTELEPDVAIEVASNSQPQTPENICLPPSSEPFKLGDLVVVTPSDYGQDKVSGRLHQISLRQISIKRTTAQIGDVVVNFPFTGYRIALDRSSGTQA